MKKINVVYYALLRQERGQSEETVEFLSDTVRELFAELKALHQFKLLDSQVKVAVNGKVCSWQTSLVDGDSVVFIPPVAGG